MEIWILNMMPNLLEFSPADNPLHRDTAAETFLCCANHLVCVALALRAKGDHSTTLTIAAQQLESVQRELLTIQLPLTKYQIESIDSQIDTLFRIVGSLEYRAGCEKHINIIHHAILALNNEIKTTH